MNLTHLKQLEAESIFIIREVAACFEKPCMFYSIGKDSTVMLHLARKAFWPGNVPFTLLHIDTTYEFCWHSEPIDLDRLASSCVNLKLNQTGYLASVHLRLGSFNV